MPDRTREVGKAGVEAELRRVAHDAEWFAPKFVSPANRGVADRICFKGIGGAVEYLHSLFPQLGEEGAEIVAREVVRRTIELAECKAPGKKLTGNQARMREKMERLGISTVVIDGKQKARDYVRG